jgi:hypothetical protein
VAPDPASAPGKQNYAALAPTPFHRLIKSKIYKNTHFDAAPARLRLCITEFTLCTVLSITIIIRNPRY